MSSANGDDAEQTPSGDGTSRAGTADGRSPDVWSRDVWSPPPPGDTVTRPLVRGQGRRAGWRRKLAVAVRTVGIVTAAAIIAVTGASWYVLHDLRNSLNTSAALVGTPRSTDGSVNILLIGLDSRRDLNGNDLPPALLDSLHVGSSSHVGGYNTNTLILMHVPDDGGRVTAFSIPRDDWVQVPGYGMAKIKQAYGLAKADAETTLAAHGVTAPADLERRSREAARRSTIQTVENLVGVPIDHFAEVNLVSFYDLANALGGVPVCLNHPVDDARFSGAVFPAGLQSLDGVQSLEFVRQRHGLPNGDLDRTHRQQAFLSGATRKLDAEGAFSDLGALRSMLGIAKRDVVVDEGWDVLSFIQQARNLTGGKAQFNTLPIQGYATRVNQSVNLVDPSQIRAIVRSAFSGPATPAPTGDAPATTTPVVDVYNGVGHSGLATRVSDVLASAGFARGQVGNDAPRATTSVHYGSGAGDGAQAVARRIGGPAAYADPELPAGRIRVDLGEGFTLPTAASARATGRSALSPSTALTSTPASATSAPDPSAPDPSAPDPSTGAASSPPSSAAIPTTGPQGAPVTAGGIPCVN